jgi:hypothetical protein
VAAAPAAAVPGAGVRVAPAAAAGVQVLPAAARVVEVSHLTNNYKFKRNLYLYEMTLF